MMSVKDMALHVVTPMIPADLLMKTNAGPVYVHIKQKSAKIDIDQYQQLNLAARLQTTVLCPVIIEMAKGANPADILACGFYAVITYIRAHDDPPFVPHLMVNGTAITINLRTEVDVIDGRKCLVYAHGKDDIRGSPKAIRQIADVLASHRHDSRRVCPIDLMRVSMVRKIQI